MLVTFQGNPVNTSGTVPKIGESAKAFTLVNTDLQNIPLENYTGKNIILNIFVSIDTGVCATSVRKFNEAASKLSNTVILCVSMDLPFAQKRFCGAENLNNVIPVSAFRNPEFGREYGVLITDSALKGLLARSIVVIDTNKKIIHTELVSEITHEPNYATALASLQKG